MINVELKLFNKIVQGKETSKYQMKINAGYDDYDADYDYDDDYYYNYYYYGDDDKYELKPICRQIDR